MHIQLAYFFRDLFRGDLGESVVSGYPVTKLIQERFIPTFSLALLTELFAVFVGVPMGVLAAWKANTWIDKSVMFLCTLGFSVPIFFLGFLFIILFGVRLEWFPVAGYVPPMEGFGAFLYRLIMPALVTGIVLLAFIARMTRANMREILQEGLHQDRQGQGALRKDGSHPPRVQERSASHRHRHRTRSGGTDHGDSHNGVSLRHSGSGPARRKRDAQQGLHDNSGGDPHHIAVLRAR